MLHLSHSFSIFKYIIDTNATNSFLHRNLLFVKSPLLYAYSCIYYRTTKFLCKLYSNLNIFFIFNIFFLLKRSYQGHKFIHSKKLLSTKIICLFWNIIKMSNLRVNSMEFFYFYFVSSSRDSFVFGLIFYYYCCLLSFACMYLEYSWGNIGYSHPLGARGAPMPKNIFKMFEKFWKKLAQSYNINVSFHKISNQNSKHCSRYKNHKFDTNVIMGQI